MSYSQTGLETVLMELLSGEGPRVCCELGAHDGLTNSNTANLVREHGWSGIFVEVDYELFMQSLSSYRGFPNAQMLRMRVTAENVNHIVQKDCRFLSIDIDGNDFWVWFALTVDPEVVCIEYNPYRSGPASVMGYDSDFKRKNECHKYGASKDALFRLGELKGYRLVHDDSQCNLLFQKRSSQDDQGIRHEAD